MGRRSRFQPHKNWGPGAADSPSTIQETKRYLQDFDLLQKTARMICRIQVRPFDYMVKAGESGPSEGAPRVMRQAKSLQMACRFAITPFD